MRLTELLVEGRHMASFYSHRPYVYTDDLGNRWQVSTSWRFGDNPKLGFEPLDSADRSVRQRPAGKALEMRYVNVVNRQTGKRRKVPIGKLSAEILQGPEPRTLDLIDDPATGTPETFLVSSYFGEKRRRLG